VDCLLLMRCSRKLWLNVTFPTALIGPEKTEQAVNRNLLKLRGFLLSFSATNSGKWQGSRLWGINKWFIAAVKLSAGGQRANMLLRPKERLPIFQNDTTGFLRLPALYIVPCNSRPVVALSSRRRRSLDT